MTESTSTESMAVLPWLEPFLSAAFFHTCEMHGSESRSPQCNMYCLRCNGDAFCKECMSARHQDHEVIQVRKNNHREAVRVSDIQNIMEISGVQTYSCNEYEVVYLKKNPQQSTSHYNSHKCETSHADPEGPFCSLRCKLEASRKNTNVIIVLSDNSKKDEEIKGREEEEQQQQQQEGVNRRRKSRKGKPSRATFF